MRGSITTLRLGSTLGKDAWGAIHSLTLDASSGLHLAESRTRNRMGVVPIHRQKGRDAKNSQR